MALLAKGSWVVVADGAKALICENTGTPRAPRLRVHHRRTQTLAPARDLVTDRPGRMPDPGPGQRSAMEATDHHRIAKERFAADLAERVNALMARQPEGRLVILAPPQLLAVLRDGLDPEAACRLIAALPRTLTQLPLSQLGGAVVALIDPL
jgi:protein required for attachment to host cells